MQFPYKIEREPVTETTYEVTVQGIDIVTGEIRERSFYFKFSSPEADGRFSVLKVSRLKGESNG